MKRVTRRQVLIAFTLIAIPVGGLMFEGSVSQATTLRCNRGSAAMASPQMVARASLAIA